MQTWSMRVSYTTLDLSSILYPPTIFAPDASLSMPSITGAPIHREGEVRIRWYDSDYTDTKLMNTTCQIVESKLFDIIIGRATLESLQLFVRNPALIGPVLTSLPTVAGNVLLQTFPLDD
jgi:hypothetical protein